LGGLGPPKPKGSPPKKKKKTKKKKEKKKFLPILFKKFVVLTPQIIFFQFNPKA